MDAGMDDSSSALDGGWGWVVVATALVTAAIEGGTTMSSSAVLYADYIEAFDETAGTVGLLKTVLNMSSCVSGMLHYCGGTACHKKTRMCSVGLKHARKVHTDVALVLCLSDYT